MDIPSSVKLDALPLPDDKGEVWLKVFPEDRKEEILYTSNATLDNDLNETKVEDYEIPY